MARRRASEVPAPATAPWDDVYGQRAPCAPESYFRSASKPNIDWDGLVGAGENPNGFTAQVPSGTQHVSGNGNNQTRWSRWDKNADGERWNGGRSGIDWARNGGNRTGE
jgi:hypothetical protein